MIRAFARPAALFLPLACPLILTACASAGDYPSLSRRDAERISGSAGVVTPEAAPAPPPAPPSGDLTQRLAQLTQQARAAHQRFAARRPSAEQAIARGGQAAVGSEGWSVATVALADLSSARSDAMIAMGSLDEIYAAESVKATETGNPADAEAAGAAQREVSGWLAEEDAVLESLRKRLRG